jgi:[ribosomal protein S5]-alanine N-acetyltransferase
LFETERCLINTLQKSDFVDVKKLYVNHDVRKFLGGIRDEDSIRVVLDEMLDSKDDSFYWVVREKHTDNFIGLVSLDPHHEGINLEISYTWRSGYDRLVCLMKQPLQPFKTNRTHRGSKSSP